MHKRTRGYVLVEALVAAAVLSATIAGAINGLASARARAAVLSKRSQAQTLLVRVVEELNASSVGSGNNPCTSLPASLSDSNCLLGVSWGTPTTWTDGGEFDASLKDQNLKVRVQSERAQTTCKGITDVNSALADRNDQAGTRIGTAASESGNVNVGSSNATCYIYPDNNTVSQLTPMMLRTPYRDVEIRVTYPDPSQPSGWAVPLSTRYRKVLG